MKKMMLMTQAIRKALPPLYTNEKKEEKDTPVLLKIFNPYGRGTWYITEFDGDDTMYGLCCIHEAELGYVSLKELDSLKIKIGRFEFPLERDLHWHGTLADARKAEDIFHKLQP
jgi:hypothetical protein